MSLNDDLFDLSQQLDPLLKHPLMQTLWGVIEEVLEEYDYTKGVGDYLPIAEAVLKDLAAAYQSFEPLMTEPATTHGHL